MKTKRFMLLLVLGCLLPCLPSAAQWQKELFLYVTETAGNSNILLFEPATGETSLLTHFPDAGTIGSISATDDGTRIVFTRPSPLNGRPNPTVWSIFPDGSGLADMITGDAALEFPYAAISPDGTRLVYCANSLAGPTDYQLYSKNLATGAITQLTLFVCSVPNMCSYPVFLDNDTVLFRRTAGYLDEYYTVNIKTPGNPVNITHNDLLAPYFPRMGRPMLNAARTVAIYGKQDQFPWGYSKWNICTRNMLTNTESVLFSNLYYGSMDPLLQPDPFPVFVGGQEMGFVGTQNALFTDLYLTEIEGVYPYQEKLTDHANPSLPFYMVAGPLPSQYLYVSSGQVCRYEGNELSYLARGEAPAVDPRGNFIAYADNGIWIARTDGTDSFRIESNPTASHPAFSPFGNWIAYVKDGDIYARLTDFSNSPVRLTATPLVGEKADLCFSPDGRRIYFTGTQSTGRRVFALPVSISEGTVPLLLPTGEPVALTPESAENYQPTVSADGRKIAFISTRAQVPELWMMDADGSQQQKVPIYVQAPVSPAFPHFSPWDPEILGYLSGFPRRLWWVDLAADPLNGNLLPAGVFPTGKAAWGRSPFRYVDVQRFITFRDVDRNLPFAYRLLVEVNDMNTSNSFVLEETIPAVWNVVEVRMNGVVQTGTNVTLSGGNKILRWLFGPAGLVPCRDTRVEIVLDISADADGASHWFTGGARTAVEMFLTRGDSYVMLQPPLLPGDGNSDGNISDEELLLIVDYWAAGLQFHGWPLDISDWDVWLLAIVDYWANPLGYEYDPSASLIAGQPQWRRK